jgi:UDP-N-acetylmuramate dehydrogenase
MDLERIAADLEPELKGKIFLREPMKNHTAWRVGGAADVLIAVKTKRDVGLVIKYAMEHQLPYIVLGNGSNVLVLDKGIRGIVLKLAGGLREINIAGQRVIISKNKGRNYRSYNKHNSPHSRGSRFF